jgi:hypothetical protein
MYEKLDSKSATTLDADMLFSEMRTLYGKLTETEKKLLQGLSTVRVIDRRAGSGNLDK